jgi:hypothetical protein
MKTEIGKACSMYGGEVRCIQGNLRKGLGTPRHRWEDNTEMDLLEE